MRVRTVTLLLLLLWGLGFALGAYEVYSVWAGHQEPPGKSAPPLGLPELPAEPRDARPRSHIRLGT